MGGFAMVALYYYLVSRLWTNIHKRGYWLDNNQTGHHFDTRLANTLIKLFDGCSVLDIGCGMGRYVRAFTHAGIDCAGYDGNPFTGRLGANFQSIDLSK